MQAKKTAPFDVSNSTKQADSNYQFNRECNHNLFECSCALACPAGGPPQADDFFFVILSDYPFASRQKEHKD
jgi:hypothetical protein